MADPPASPPSSADRLAARRIFFVNPPSVVEESMIQFLVSAQYEAAVVRDYRRLPAILRAYPRSIDYFNIDNGMSEPEWERFIRGIIIGKARHGASVGVISYNDNQELTRKYLMDVGVEAGFIKLKLGFQESARILFRSLDAAEAKGGRRYIRAKVPAGKASLNLAMDGKVSTGELEDISAVGMACYLPAEYGVGTSLSSVQLRLWGSLVLVDCKVVGTRAVNGRTLTVLLFDAPMPAATRGKIFTFVRRVIQHEADLVV